MAKIIKRDKGEPVIELRPVSNPIDWLAVLVFADEHENIDDNLRDSLFELLYKHPVDRKKVRKIRIKSHLIKLANYWRANFLKEQIDNKDWYQEQRNKFPHKFFGEGWGKEE